MPKSYVSNFDPETPQMIQEAFDAAWSEVAASPGVMVDQEAARKMIANRIHRRSATRVSATRNG